MDRRVAAVGCAGLLLAYAAVKISKKRKRTCWTKPWLLRRDEGRGVLNMIENELKEEEPILYKNYVRMTDDNFEELLLLVKDDIEKQDTHMRKAISARKRLALTLRFLATGETYRSLMLSVRIHESTISLIIPGVCKAIYERLAPHYLKVPRSEEEWKAVARKFYGLWGYPMCIGALDGKHIEFRAPISAGSYYYNYKGQNSIVLLALADAESSFLYLDIGANGRVSDGGVYRESSLKRCVEDENILNIPENECLPNGEIKIPYHIVADDAFPLTQRIMKPYPFRNMTPDQITFNKQLSRARRVVENAFGILANRFRVLLSKINLSPEKVEDVVKATVALHNFLAKKNKTAYIGTEEESADLRRAQNTFGNRTAESVLNIRAELTRYFFQRS